MGSTIIPPQFPHAYAAAITGAGALKRLIIFPVTIYVVSPPDQLSCCQIQIRPH